MILHYKGVKFTDNQIAPADFAAQKSSEFLNWKIRYIENRRRSPFFLEFPNGQVPVLEVDDKKLSQSNAIYRYLGRKFGEFLEKSITLYLKFPKALKNSFISFKFFRLNGKNRNRNSIFGSNCGIVP